MRVSLFTFGGQEFLRLTVSCFLRWGLGVLTFGG